MDQDPYNQPPARFGLPDSDSPREAAAGTESDPTREAAVYRTLYELSLSMATGASPAQNLARIAGATCELTGTDLAVVAFQDPPNNRLEIKASAGLRSDASPEAACPLVESIGREVLVKEKGVIIKAVAAETRLPEPSRAAALKEGVVAGMAVPIQGGEKPMGVLYAFNRTATRFQNADLRVLEHVAAIAAVETGRRPQFREHRAGEPETAADHPTQFTETDDQLRAEIEKRRKYLESILDNAPDAIVTLDARHRVVEWNPGAVKMFGYTREETLGRPLDDLLNKKDSLPEASAKTRQVLSGQPVRAFESVRYRKDGSGVNVIAAGAPIHSNEKLAGVVAVYTDITSLKRAEKALLEREFQMREIFRTMPDPVVLFRAKDGCCVDVNTAFVRAAGISRRKATGRTVTELLAWENPTAPDKLFQEIRDKGEIKNRAARFNLGSGKTMEILLSARSLTLNGCPHILAIGRDISALKAAEKEKEKLSAQLRQAQKMEAIGTLAGGIAHDFNNLLMGIQGRASLLNLKSGQVDGCGEHIRGIEAYVRRATDLTKQILGFARGGKYEVRQIHPNQLIFESLKLFGRTSKEINIHTRLVDDAWSITADRGQIEQVLLNLCVNAWQAMPGGGNLFVATQNVVLDPPESSALCLSPGDFVRIEVTDTGIGMDTSILERIFDPFFTTKARGSGTGLGLASAYGIINNHGGCIDVQSTPGKGTSFFVYLPAVRLAASGAVQPAVAPDQHLLTGSETILIVDDEQMILDVGKEMLDALGYQVITALGGSAGLEAYTDHEKQISLVILDMIMPGMSCEETFQGLKQINPEVAVVLSSGYSINDQAAKILRQGCRGFIQKPFSLKRISEKIRSVLDK